MNSEDLSWFPWYGYLLFQFIFSQYFHHLSLECILKWKWYQVLIHLSVPVFLLCGIQHSCLLKKAIKVIFPVTSLIRPARHTPGLLSLSIMIKDCICNDTILILHPLEALMIMTLKRYHLWKDRRCVARQTCIQRFAFRQSIPEPHPSYPQHLFFWYLVKITLRREGTLQGTQLPMFKGHSCISQIYVACVSTTTSERKGNLTYFAVSQGKRELFCQGNNNT